MEGRVEEPAQLRAEPAKQSRSVKSFEEHVARACDVATCEAEQARH
jgi:hypothetical protein